MKSSFGCFGGWSFTLFGAFSVVFWVRGSGLFLNSSCPINEELIGCFWK